MSQETNEKEQSQASPFNEVITLIDGLITTATATDQQSLRHMLLQGTNIDPYTDPAISAQGAEAHAVVNYLTRIKQQMFELYHAGMPVGIPLQAAEDRRRSQAAQRKTTAIGKMIQGGIAESVGEEEATNIMADMQGLLSAIGQHVQAFDAGDNLGRIALLQALSRPELPLNLNQSMVEAPSYQPFKSYTSPQGLVQVFSLPTIIDGVTLSFTYRGNTVTKQFLHVETLLPEER